MPSLRMVLIETDNVEAGLDALRACFTGQTVPLLPAVHAAPALPAPAAAPQLADDGDDDELDPPPRPAPRRQKKQKVAKNRATGGGAVVRDGGRSDRIVAFLKRQGRPCSSSEIGAHLQASSSMGGYYAKMAVKAGKLQRVGSGRSAAYWPAGEAMPASDDEDGSTPAELAEPPPTSAPLRTVAPAEPSAAPTPRVVSRPHPKRPKDGDGLVSVEAGRTLLTEIREQVYAEIALAERPLSLAKLHAELKYPKERLAEALHHEWFVVADGGYQIAASALP